MEREFNELPSIQRVKRPRKASQLAQFSVYEDQTSRADSPKSDTSFNLSQNEFEPHLQKIQPHISVEIPFHPEFHSKSNFLALEVHSQNTSNILQSLAINIRQRVPKIPKKWTENQPNDHISTLFFYFLLFLLIFSLYSIYITNISIAPSISDDSTADKKLNNFLIPSAETAEQVENRPISEILRPLPNFEPLSLKTHLGQPRNLDLNKHWHPLALFQLFFDWKTMGIIVKETNSFAFHNNSAQNPWVSLSIKELYHFFGCLLLLSLYKQSPRAYSWRLNGVLSKTPLSKNRFEQIIRNFHFKDRGLNLINKKDSN